jgi:adenosylmethionine-8-amino-7-oxononanoate aminotransferase
MKKTSYSISSFYTTDAFEDLCRELIDSTHGFMSRAYIVNSGMPHHSLVRQDRIADYDGAGSEAMEAAMKLARQFYLEKNSPEPSRTKFIARNHSYHGTTLGALSMGGHVGRRAKFEPMLLNNISRVSPCFAYRHKLDGESDEAFVSRLAEELDQEFQRLGPETVCAFVAEPVVGAVCSPLSSGRPRLMCDTGLRMRAICPRLLQGYASSLRQVWCASDL